MDKGAKISDCGRYRYLLWRTWDPTKGKLVCCLLNPSTADAVEDDPTVIRCIERAKRLGFGGLEIVNLFAFRSPDPKNLYREEDPIGPFNNEYIKMAATSRLDNMFLCGWGKHGVMHARDKHVLYMLKNIGVSPYALKLNKCGSPMHPLYIGYDVYPFRIGESP